MEKKALAELSRMETLFSKALESMGEGYVREKVRVKSEEVDSEGENGYNRSAESSRKRKYISYDKVGIDNVAKIKDELKKLYSETESGVATEIAVEVGDSVYIVDSGKENGKINLGISKELYFEDASLRSEFIRRNNYDAVSKGCVSDGLSRAIRSEILSDRRSGGRQEKGSELQSDKGKSEHNEGRVSETDADRRGLSHSRKSAKTGDVFEDGEGLGTVTIKTVGKDKKRYKEGFKGAVATKSERLYIRTVDEMFGVQRYLERTGTDKQEARSLIQAVRSSPSQAQSMIGSVQYNVFAKGKAKEKKLGKGIQQIYKPLARRGSRVVQMFDDYLFHYLNIDKYKAFESVRESQEDDLKALHKTQEQIDWLESRNRAIEKDIFKLGKTEEDMTKKARFKSVIEENNRKLQDLRKDEEFLLLRTTAFVGSEIDRISGKIRSAENECARTEREMYELGNSSHYMKKKRELKDRLTEMRENIGVLKKRRSRLEEMNKVYNYALKPVFDIDGETVTREESESYISKYEATHPEFKAIAKEVWAYAENLNKMRESAGLISSHIRKRMHEMYPHYVPAWRAEEKNASKYDKGIAVGSTVKTAKGYNHTLEWIEEALAAQTKQVLRNGHINVLANSIYDGAVKSGDLKYVDVGFDADAAENLNHAGEGRPKPHKVTFLKNGAEYTMEVSDEIFSGFKGVTEATVSPSDPVSKSANFINKWFKRFVTSLSPAFTIRNAIRDMQDAGINTKHGVKFLKNIPIAWKEILSNGEMWQLYRAHGGFSSTVFDSKGFEGSVGNRGFETIKLFERIASGRKFKTRELVTSLKYAKDLLRGMENVNAFIEQIPRFAEFLASMDAGESVETAIYNSAEVTTNFGRRGALVKHLNSTLIPFLNPAVQGFDKIFRNVGDAVLGKGSAKAAVGGVISLFTKAFLIGMVPMILNALLYSDDEDYERLREEDKENNYLFKLPNGTFLKLPRGRMASVYAGFANRMTRIMQGKDGDWGGYFKNVVSQVTPVENATRTIFSPILSDVRTNTTWYGTAIEGQQFENVRPSERYDESTSSIAIALGKAFNYSPKKIHYLIDQYSGVIGDFLLPATTAKAEKDFISGNFTIDPVTSNKLSTEFYKLFDEAKYAKTDGDTDAIYQVKYFNEVASAISTMYDEISTIQNSDASTADKLNGVRTIRAMINAALENAINDYGAFSTAVRESAAFGYDDSNATQQKLRYTEVVKDVYGAERALKTYNKDVYEKMSVLNKSGISYDVLYDYYFDLKDIEGDTDKDGNTVSGSKRKKVVAAIAAMDISLEEKMLLLTAKGYALKDGDVKGLSADAAKRRLAKYIVSLKISTEEKKAILEECGFTVKDGKVILSDSKKTSKTTFKAPVI